MIRDFSYLSALKRKKGKVAKEILRELDKTIDYFSQLVKSDNETMLLITSAEPYKLALPKMGKSWFDFEKRGKNLIYYRPSLISPLFVQGARSENFCGLYHETDIFKRILTGQDLKRIDLDWVKNIF